MNATNAVSNVVSIYSSEQAEAGIKILGYLEDKQRKSKNTYKNYVRYYTEFFKFACDKEIGNLLWSDILAVTYSKVDDYKRFLLDKGDSANYVNQKMFAMKALWQKLFFFNRDVVPSTFEFEEEEIEEKNHASMDDAEMQMLFDYMDKEKSKSLTKRMFFEFLYVVGCRKNVPMELKWSDIVQKKDHRTGVSVWVVKFFDKGKWVEKAINDDFYGRLSCLRIDGSEQDKVFNIGKSTIEKVFAEFVVAHDMTGKGICIHSIKKAGAWRVQNTFKDINMTKQFCQHKNVNLTYRVYANENNYSEQPSYLIGKEIDMTAFEDMSREELLNMIANAGRETQMRLYYANQK